MFSPDVILCGRLGLKHQLTNSLTPAPIPLRAAYQSSTFDQQVAELALDDDITTCAVTLAKHEHYWEATLGRADKDDLYYVSRVTIVASSSLRSGYMYISRVV